MPEEYPSLLTLLVSLPRSLSGIYKWIAHLRENQRQTSPRLANCWMSLMETKHELAGSEGALQAGQRQRAAASPTTTLLLTDRKKGRKKNKQQQRPAITSFLCETSAHTQEKKWKNLVRVCERQIFWRKDSISGGNLALGWDQLLSKRISTKWKLLQQNEE